MRTSSVNRSTVNATLRGRFGSTVTRQQLKAYQEETGINVAWIRRDESLRVGRGVYRIPGGSSVASTVTTKAAATSVSGLAIGFALATVHLIGIPLTGTSVNPARSIGPALFAGGPAIDQLWLFIVAPLLGGALAAVVSRYLYPQEDAARN